MYDKTFYFSSKGEGDVFSRIPQGKLIVNRVLRNQAPFKKAHVTSQLKPKSLVIADWTLNNLEDWEFEKIIQSIRRLMEDGFPVYLWQDGQVIALGEENVNCLKKKEVRQLITPTISRKIIADTAAQHHLIRDQIKILDKYWLTSLLKTPASTESQQLFLSDLVASDDISTVLATTKQATPPFDAVIIDCDLGPLLTLKTLNVESLLSTLSKEIAIRTQYRQLELNREQLEALLREGLLTINNETWTISELSALEKLTINYYNEGELKAEELATVVDYFPNLKSLNLKNLNLSTALQNSSKIATLEALSITHVTTDVASLESLLVSASSLKSLTVQDITLVDTCPFTRDLNLGHITSLQLKKFNYAIEDNLNKTHLKDILEQSKSVKSLELEHDDLASFFTTPFNSLRALKLSPEVDVSELSTISVQAPAIEVLNLSGITITFNDSALMQDIHFSNLKELDASASEITIATLESILKHAKHLESLNLTECEELCSEIPLTANFEHLKRLHLFESEVTEGNLATILTQATKLETLSLGKNFGLCAPLPKEVEFPYLKALHLKGQEIDNNYFSYSLLQKATELTSLELNFCIIRSNATQGFNLTKLKKFHAINTSIHGKDLNSLLRQTNLLEDLNLESDQDDPEDLIDFTVGVNFSNIKYINLSHNSLKVSDLEAIFNQASELKSLNLADCNGLFSPFKEKHSFRLARLEDLSLSSSDISQENLKAIIRAAPNLKKLDICGCQFDFIDDELKKLLEERNLLSALNQLEQEDSEEVRSKSRSQHGFRARTDDDESVHSHSSYDSKVMDADTKFNPNKKFNVKRTFFPLDSETPVPDVTMYRKSVYNDFEVNEEPCLPNQAFLLRNVGDLSLVEPTNIQQTSSVEEIIEQGQRLIADEKRRQSGVIYYFGHQEGLVPSPEGAALDSWVAHEMITHYHLDPPVPGVELKYSQRDNLYYLYGPGDKAVNISFLLKIESQPALPSTQALYCENVEKYFKQKFGSDALKFQKTNPTGEDYLEAIIDQEKGACRHRTLAFQELVRRENHDQVLTRFIGNSCHAFPEIYLCNQWVKIDLGGYPAECKINDSNHPDKVIKSQSVAKANTPKTITASEHIFATQPKYAKYLATWEKSKPEATSTKHYCQHLAKPEKKKTLVELSSSEAVSALQISLQDYCKRTSRPYFYINSPDDLVCSAPFIKRTGKIGALQKGPGGPLHDFLESYRTSTAPVYLIVNYDNFDADDIVRLNALIDKAPNADGTPLPVNTQIIGLINTRKPDCYQGEDFYSRFDAVEACPVTDEMLFAELNRLAPLPAVDMPVEATHEANTLDLYNAPDWKERLLGYWAVRGNQLQFVEGALHNALKKPMPIEIKNGPWDDQAFKQFWQQTIALGYVDYEGQRISLPKDFQLKVSKGYDWAYLVTNVAISHLLNTQAEVLNPGQFGSFFNQYSCQDKQLLTTTGLIEHYTGQALAVHLTRELTDDQWAMFLAACQKHKVKLTVHVAPGVKLPAALNRYDLIKVPPAFSTWRKTTHDSIVSIISDDISATIHQLTLGNNDYCVIDVSECEPSDLLVDLHAEFNHAQGLVFESFKRALLKAIEDGTPIILKGHFSQDLIDALAPFLLSHLDKLKPNQLTLVSHESSFPYLPITRVHNVELMDKWALLQRLFPTEIYKLRDESLFVNETFDKLYSRLLYLRSHPNKTNSELNWAGLEGISGGVKLKDFDKTKSAVIAEEFDRQRLAAVNAVLAYSPHVFLAGLTGVGKSTFVEKHFKNKTNVNLYQGLDNLLNWATDSEFGQQKILFIDEANLLPSEFSAFKGLFNKPPTVLIKGVIHELSSDHKVIFAGNPLNYGDERRLASLFAEHGRAVIFEPMPQEYIYEKILKPVFAESGLDEESVLKVSCELLKVYRFLCESSAESVLISPREVQMMALFVASHLKNRPNLNLSSDILSKLASYYAYNVVAENVPTAGRLKFDEQFKPKIKTADVAALAVTKDFLLTPSRRPVWQQLQALLALRVYRQQGANEAQKYGGLGGLILEGDPGTGKSELVMASLIAQGYQQVSIHVDSNQSLPEKIFYHIPVSLSLEEKKACLLKAFNEGAVVVIDEINSSPMMERLINDLLMGYNDKKERPKKPGFLIIGTQNPVTMAGRRHPSDALARRLIKATLPPYNTAEMEAILQAKGLSKQQIIELIEAYEVQVKRAARENLTPAPTFRDLLRLADNILIAQSKKLQDAEKMTLTPIEEEDLQKRESIQPRKRKEMVPGFFSTNQEQHQPLPTLMKASKEELEVGTEKEVSAALTDVAYSSQKERALEQGRSIFTSSTSQEAAKKRRKVDKSTGMQLP
ncbi:AAA family ATPase [Legionella sp. CNM-1927-20]|uniref:AAA family ATPase n=1 Tax=Legionella sp. CNM-1927-20 TaxID=3422221 RepID=UPI00403B0E0F